MHKIVVALFLALMGIGAVGFSHQASAQPPTAPMCQGQTATKWLPADQPGTLIGTSGPDVLVGTIGADVIKGLGGDDIICGGSEFSGGIDTVSGGSGNDSIYARGDVKGDAGNDSMTVFGGASQVGSGGSGDDYIVAYFVKADGGSGNDSLDMYYGGDANGGSGNDYISIPSNGAANQVLGGSGSDTIISIGTTNAIDCGSHTDTVQPGIALSVKRCENTQNP